MGSQAQVLESLRAAGLGDVLYLPGQEAYNDRIDSHWSLTSRLEPWAIVQPRDTAEVSNAVKAIVSVPDVKFAVRSGGHTTIPGANSIIDGIAIDLGLMDNTTYDATTQLASLQPGGTWAKTYVELEKHGRMVAGGREGKVGIGGLLTGGGKTFYTCRVGFACDQVVNYEVVLADGRIVNASSKENNDLFRALKGGGNNFGIVTRFDMSTFPAKDIWECTININRRQTGQLAQALIDFTSNLAEHPNNHVFTMWTFTPKMREPFMIINLMNLDGEPEPSTLRGFLDIPLERLENAEPETVEDFFHQPGGKYARTASLAMKVGSFFMPSGKHDTSRTLTFKADVRIVLKTAAVFESLVQDLSLRFPSQDFDYFMVLQPLPVSFAAHSTARGGNMMGLDQIRDDCILLAFTIEVEDVEMNWTVVRPAMESAFDEIDGFARSVGGDVGFRYLNYCGKGQDPLASYGEGNVRIVKEVARKYDPEGVFQRRVPGGFKISKVGTGG